MPIHLIRNRPAQTAPMIYVRLTSRGSRKLTYGGRPVTSCFRFRLTLSALAKAPQAAHRNFTFYLRDDARARTDDCVGNWHRRGFAGHRRWYFRAARLRYLHASWHLARRARRKQSFTSEARLKTAQSPARRLFTIRKCK